MMDFFEPPHHFHQRQQQQIHHHDGLASYSDAQGLHSYAMAAQQQSAMMGLPPSAAKSNETKPRLGKDEVEILEKEFKKNPKPTTQTKRQFAEEMGVDLARINNWFQNRRAKRKQEKKQEEFESQQPQEAPVFSEPSSPDYLVGSSSYFSDSHLLTAPFMPGPPPAVAPCNPQYQDPSIASMESLHRTVAAVQAVSRQHEYGTFLDQNESFPNFGGPLMLQAIPNGDRAQFPSSDNTMVSFSAGEAYYGSSNVSSLYSMSNPSIPELTESPADITNTPTPFQYSGAPPSQAMAAFPSQLLPNQSGDGLPSLSHDLGESQSPEGSEPSTVEIGFKYEGPESDASASPPAPTVPFKAPTPMDIASRRKKVHVKPAALTADTLRGRPPLGPRTVSHADGFRRPSDSPIGSPMRRIASAGGNRNILTGRINKSGVESAQRSPINLGGFAEVGAFLEHNYHNIRQPSLTAGSSLQSSLAPPTPLSPRPGLDLMPGKRDHSRSDASSPNFVFNGLTGGFNTMEGEASPPETPQNSLPILPGWPTGHEYPDKIWQYDVPDEPLYTPAQESFQNLEIQMPQPSYLSSLSQPVTPAFGHFNPSVIFAHDSPHYNLSNTEYAFPESNPHFMGAASTSPMTKQKTFQFSHSTPADFTEK